MVVALGTPGRQAKPDSAESANVFAFKFIKLFLFDGTCFTVRIDDPVVARGDQVVVSRFGQQVTRQLGDREFVEGHVVAKRVHDPGPVGSRRDRLVAYKTTGVGPANQIQPANRLVFGIG